MDQRVWLCNPGSGGTFHCPVDAVDDHIAMGWQKSDPPVEPNPAVAEQLAWRAEQAEQTAKSTKSARRGETTGDVSNG